jgi:uncharacterized protein (TIGR00255 family)
MALSMTGWGSCKTLKYTITIKGLNSKYKEIFLHMPQEFFAIEPLIYKYLNDNITRGKVDVYVNINKAKLEKKVVLNKKLFKSTYDSLKKLLGSVKYKKEMPLNIIFSNVDGIISLEDAADPEIFDWARVKKNFAKALSSFNKMKEKEGRDIAADTEKKLVIIEKQTLKIKEMYEEFKGQYMEKARERIKTIFAGHESAQDNQNFLRADIVEVLDKYDITEEIVRLQSHLKQASCILKNEKLIGKKLDFLAQEMHREANTITSKISSSDIVHSALAIKENIDKIREQSQNME